jgi:hypothetical protein
MVFWGAQHDRVARSAGKYVNLLFTLEAEPVCGPVHFQREQRKASDGRISLLDGLISAG